MRTLGKSLRALTLLGLLAVCILAGPAFAQTAPQIAAANTGNDFLRMDAGSQLLYASGFLAGINYFYLYASSERYSLPSNMTSRAMAGILSDYLRRRPEEIYQDLDYLAFKAVIEAYPLPRPWR